MTTPTDFDRIAADWLRDGPTELPARVVAAVADEIHLTRRRRAFGPPRRFPTVTSPTRLAALVAVAALFVVGALALGAGRTSVTPAPSSVPVASAAAAGPSPAATSPVGVIPMGYQTFTSDRNGFSIAYPAGWTTVQATASRDPEKGLQWGQPSGALDIIRSRDARLYVSVVRYPDQSLDRLLKSTCLEQEGRPCQDPASTWERIDIGATKGYLTADGIPTTPDISELPGRLYDAIAITPHHLYEFTMDGNVTRKGFQAVLGTVRLFPGNAVDTPPPSSRFTSPTYGYSVGIQRGWSAAGAAMPWHGVDNRPEMMDTVTMWGTDTSFSAASQPLGGQTYEEFLAAFHANALAAVPAGCDGGEPSAWPAVRIGKQVGRLETRCDAAAALVEDGDRVYVFEWGNDTFDSDKHFTLAAWKELLKSIILTPETAK